MKSKQYLTLGDNTYKDLKNLIISGKIKPGERLLYSELVDKLGVSQTPIREAFTRLENDGYLITIKRRGTFVREVSEKDIKEIFQIREMLEALAARLVCIHATEEDIDELEKINNRFCSAAQKGDSGACTQEDLCLHETILKLSHNTMLMELLSKTHYNLLSIVRRNPQKVDASMQNSDMHLKIIDALRRRNEEEAEQLMRLHIRNGMQEILSLEPVFKKANESVTKQIRIACLSS